ncbi:MAG TPA: hypoxanthine phosphoribosyltransferase [Chthonomonadales bacterium]|nr:hypoxanthine phosphoribosyltransferase [Chthonomonadales bacterium]
MQWVTPEVLISADAIQQRVAELGARISADYAGRELCIIGVLTGAAIFLSDLIRQITIPLEIDFVATSSYGAATRSSGEVRLLKDLSHPVQGKHVLLVEDIVDTGLTLRYLFETLHARQPISIAGCTLLDKPSRRLVEVPVKYCGFQIEDKFVVGYGLDCAGRYRNLPYIGVLPV